MNNESETLTQIQSEDNIPGAPNGQKRKENKPKREAKGSIERLIKGIHLDIKDRVTLKIVELITIPPKELDGESTIKTRTYKMVSEDKPHSDLINALKMLRKDALKICEIDIPADSNKLHQYQVMGVDISGDIVLKQARLVLTIGKLVKRTEKIIKFKTPQTTLYGQSEYEDADKLAPKIEKVLDEAEEYMYGKFEETNPHQLGLFNK